MVRMAVYIDGNTIGYQFNRDSNGVRKIYRQVSACGCGCGWNVIRFRGQWLRVDVHLPGVARQFTAQVVGWH